MDYYCFNDPFLDHVGSPDLNLPPITIDDIPLPDKISHYNPDLLPDAISVASEKYVSNLTTPYYSPQVIVLTYDDPNPHYVMKNYNPFRGIVKRVYCNRKLYGEKCYKKTGFIPPRVLKKTGNFITVVDFPKIIQI